MLQSFIYRVISAQKFLRQERVTGSSIANIYIATAKINLIVFLKETVYRKEITLWWISCKRSNTSL